MSGGRLDDYGYFRLHETIEAIQLLIENNDSEELDEWGDQIGNHYSEETVAKFKEAVKILTQAYVYAKRIDWLVSGDDGELEFHRRLTEELSENEQ